MFGVEKLVTNRMQTLNGIVQKSSMHQIMPKDEFASKNLLHFLKKKLRSTDEITEFLSKLTDDEKYIGTLPDKWREKFEPIDIKDKTKQIQRLFSEFAKDAYSSAETSADELSEQTNNLSKKLENVLGEKCAIEFVGSGDYGKVFKIHCAEENLALKIYHNDSSVHLLDYHGKTKEIANAVALNHSLKPNQCARFYCGKVTINSEPDAFMLSQFVESEGKSTPKEKFCAWVYKKFYIGDSQKKGNIIDGKITDFGGISYNFKNQAQQDFAKKLFPLIVKGDSEEILKMKEKYANNKDFNELLAGIIRFKSNNLKNPITFAIKANQGFFTKEEIAAYKALGMDFSVIENYDYSDAPQEVVKALKDLGLSIK